MQKGKIEQRRSLGWTAMDYCSETRFIEIMEGTCSQTESQVN